MQNLRLLASQDHERHGNQSDGHAHNDIDSKRLAEEDCADGDGCHRLEDTEDRSAGRTDDTGRYGQGQKRDKSRENGKADNIEPAIPAVDTGHQTAATYEIMQEEHHGTDKKRIESQEVVGNGTETTAPVYHYKIKGIGQCRTAGKKKTHGIEGNIARRTA